MRSSQSHQRAFKFVLGAIEEPGSSQVRVDRYTDCSQRHVSTTNTSSKTDRSATEPRPARRQPRSGRDLAGGTAIPIDPEMPSRTPRPPDQAAWRNPGGLPRGRQGPLCRTNPATDRTLAGRSALLRNSRGSIHQMTYLPADQQVYERKFSTLKLAASGLARAITTRSG